MGRSSAGAAGRRDVDRRQAARWRASQSKPWSHQQRHSAPVSISGLPQDVMAVKSKLRASAQLCGVAMEWPGAWDIDEEIFFPPLCLANTTTAILFTAVRRTESLGRYVSQWLVQKFPVGSLPLYDDLCFPSAR